MPPELDEAVHLHVGDLMALDEREDTIIYSDLVLKSAAIAPIEATADDAFSMPRIRANPAVLRQARWVECPVHLGDITIDSISHPIRGVSEKFSFSLFARHRVWRPLDYQLSFSFVLSGL
jgi:hypothetical protein